MRKRMIVLSVITFLAIIIFIVVYSEEAEEVNEAPNIYTNEMSSVELFIQKYLLTDNRMIRTNFPNRKGGEIFLSESLGLWMEYLVAKGDMTQFEYAYETMKREFQLPNHLLSWKIDHGEKAQTNALIDDLRVVEALFKMGELTNNHTYIDEAISIAEAMKEHHVYKGFFVDYYDAEQEVRNDYTTIAYVKPTALSYMEKYKVIKADKLDRMIAFLEALPQENGFYPHTYYIEDDRYEYEEDVNMIDQLYIGLHQEQAKIDSSVFFHWVKEEFYEHGQLSGRYDAKTKKATGKEEPIAVYSLATVYALERGDEKLAKDLYQHMVQLQVTDMSDPYFGGFVANEGEDTYSFANLLASIAERKLQYAKVIP